MSKKKQGGKTAQHIRPAGKRLGVKVTDGLKVKVGEVLVRQRGTKIKAGDGVKVGRDHTLFAVKEGVVKFRTVGGEKEMSVIS